MGQVGTVCVAMDERNRQSTVQRARVEQGEADVLVAAVDEHGRIGLKRYADCIGKCHCGRLYTAEAMPPEGVMCMRCAMGRAGDCAMCDYMRLEYSDAHAVSGSDTDVVVGDSDDDDNDNNDDSDNDIAHKRRLEEQSPPVQNGQTAEQHNATRAT